MAVAGAQWSVFAVGSGGIDELSTKIDDTTVMWALQRIQVGSGTFIRKKLVAIVCNGENTPVMQRAKLKMQTGQAVDILGAQMTVEVMNAADCNVEKILGEVLPFIVADGGAFTVARLREEYDKSLVEARVKKRFAKVKIRLRGFLAFQSIQTRPETPGAGLPGPEAHVSAPETAIAEKTTPAEKVEVTLTDALKAVASQYGAFNWVILEPVELGLHNAGCGGFEEMKDWLEPDKVMFCVFRASFDATGAFKHVFTHWIGPNVSAVKCGQWNSKVPQAEEIVRSHISINLKKTAHNLDDMDLPEFMNELRRLTYNVDDDFGSLVSQQRASICQEYLGTVMQHVQSLPSTDAEEHAQAEPADQEVKEEEEEETNDADEPAELPTLEQALSVVQSIGGEWNWLLIRYGVPST